MNKVFLLALYMAFLLSPAISGMEMEFWDLTPTDTQELSEAAYHLGVNYTNENKQDLKKVIIQRRIAPNIIEHNPLLIAIQHGDKELVEFLLEHGADPSFLTPAPEGGYKSVLERLERFRPKSGYETLYKELLVMLKKAKDIREKGKQKQERERQKEKQ